MQLTLPYYTTTMELAGRSDSDNSNNVSEVGGVSDAEGESQRDIAKVIMNAQVCNI